jgi:hypothetical protein
VKSKTVISRKGKETMNSGKKKGMSKEEMKKHLQHKIKELSLIK